MEPRQITGVYGEVSGLPAPVSAHVREEQLQEPRIYTVTAGERSPSLPPHVCTDDDDGHYLFITTRLPTVS